MLTFTAESPFEKLDNGLIRRQGVMNNGARATEVKFDAGTFGQLQKRDYALQTHVVSGEFEFTVGNDSQVVVAGETIAIPANTASGCFCLTAGTLWDIVTTN
ncbi:Cupin 2, conserved barrel domain protein [Serratia proteamaculans]|uniref:cupin n=1 Tax=Serratia proteamaculans TaxID=28151 RepID=UPI0009F7DF37|nr:cupin [Serratia proteamaculans]SMB34436.1 Cupin 2, conserved barrel domain protein [Serratia proteamaculans]